MKSKLIPSIILASGLALTGCASNNSNSFSLKSSTGFENIDNISNVSSPCESISDKSVLSKLEKGIKNYSSNSYPFREFKACLNSLDLENYNPNLKYSVIGYDENGFSPSCTKHLTGYAFDIFDRPYLVGEIHIGDKVCTGVLFKNK